MTVYGPAVEAEIVEEVSPVFQRYCEPAVPVAASITLLPWHVSLTPVMLTCGNSLTTTVEL